MHISVSFPEGFYTDQEYEEKRYFLAELSQACRATVDEADGCSDEPHKVVFSVSDIPIDDETHGQFARKSGFHGPLGAIAHQAQLQLGATVRTIVIVAIDMSKHLPEYRISCSNLAETA